MPFRVLGGKRRPDCEICRFPVLPLTSEILQGDISQGAFHISQTLISKHLSIGLCHNPFICKGRAATQESSTAVQFLEISRTGSLLPCFSNRVLKVVRMLTTYLESGTDKFNGISAVCKRFILASSRFFSQHTGRLTAWHCEFGVVEGNPFS